MDGIAAKRRNRSVSANTTRQTVSSGHGPDTLREEIHEWVREGIISEEQGEAILARYETDDPGRSRAVLALSLVGAALVVVGVVLFLATNWADLPRAARAAVLLAAPALPYAGAVLAYRRRSPRVGHALGLLGAILVGPSAFLLDDLFALGLATAWLLFAWTAVALPTGHALASRPGTGLGLLLVVALIADLATPADPLPAVGLLGIVVFGVGSTREGRVRWTYRVRDAAIALGASLLLTTLDGDFDRFDPEPTAVTLAAAAGAVSTTAWLGYAGKRAERDWAILALLALSVSVAAALAPGTVPEVAFAGTHLGSLLALFATDYLGYRARSRSFVDLAVLGALLQTLSFVTTTVVGTLSGSIVLVVAGLVSLAIRFGLERGRRSVLAGW